MACPACGAPGTRFTATPIFCAVEMGIPPTQADKLARSLLGNRLQRSENLNRLRRLIERVSRNLPPLSSKLSGIDQRDGARHGGVADVISRPLISAANGTLQSNFHALVFFC